ncbi:hypothetical protein CEUSTIGMA_g8273.t1 [Chlamydomonas eustigma]|uniref:Phosphatidate cytidylyltransferase, mitochondrial n=1 Tax=Chlamydomonas eustigma TaxID=1157962 RepID=A0A250XCM7_9CHLO|nr:hypothetical protein CEUSTIGMA_g8273.t1 [Chlamydomonas eustigma]|eukprot:GAX80838.1 hypothetical protein CEUSTIGMA_g8273.t1 [Chlamydomonas eustigma]
MAKHVAPLLRRFPDMTFAFAYGSGVMHQPGLYSSHTLQAHARSSTLEMPMTDLIFVVEDARSWHRKNISVNPDHYSWLFRSKYGHHMVCDLAESVGVGVHFNALVQVNDQVIKYGVIEVQHLIQDLEDWRSLYIGGRMQKPVMTLLENSKVQKALARNLKSALTAALLLLPEKFSIESLLKSICSLSYNGDIRVGLAEDPMKIGRIVEGSREGLEAMYLPMLLGKDCCVLKDEALGTNNDISSHKLVQGHAQDDKEETSLPFPGVVVQASEGFLQQDMSQQARLELLRQLPVCILHGMSRRLGFDVPENHLIMDETREHVLIMATASGRHTELLSASIKAIVRSSSMVQAISGAMASDGGKAIRYMISKLRKAGWLQR